MFSSKEPDVDEDLYDEDGLLKEDKEATYGDKFNLINSMHKILQIKKKGRGAVRREALKNVEEFVAVKKKGVSSLNKLLESVKDTGDEKSVNKVSKLVKAPSLKPLKTLEVPLEKPQALKTKRTVLYDNAKKEVSRFNAIVYHNRVAEQLVYPLDAGKKVAKQSPKDRLADFIPMTPLEEEMARVLHGEEYVARRKAEMQKPVGPSDAEAYALSVEEALNLHGEMARLRAQQSYQMAKAKRQNKIKSKKYHRLLRKEKIRKQLKEFEELQQKDPEGALLKLDELNRSRVEERMSLKHRNTSKWAKMHAARAKYNKDSRIALSEQLQISKQLTQKVEESSEEEEDLDLELPNLVKSSMDNPWMLNPDMKDNEKLQLYYCGYKKLYEQINAKKDKEKREQDNVEKEVEDEKVEIVERLQEKEEDDEPILELEESVFVKKLKPKKKRKKKQKVGQQEKPSSNKRKIEDEDGKDFTDLDLDMMIEEAEDKIKGEASKELRKLTKEEKQKTRAMERRKKKIAIKLAQKKSKKATKGDADEIREFEVNSESQLLENGVATDSTKRSKPIEADKKNAALATIDPSNYLKITKNKSSKFDGRKVSFDAFDSEDEEEEGDDDGEDDKEGSQRKLIAEAFEDDNVVDEFRKKKQEEIEGSQPKDIDLSLPGWGSWGGKGIVPNPKKKARFVIKAPPPAPRRDAQLSHVILNEEAGEKIKEHLVRELPFPFSRVKDFEKSIRAPVGRTWLPQQATKDMTAPKVITRLGTVIEPLDEDVLVKTKDGQSKKLQVPISIKRLARVKK